MKSLFGSYSRNEETENSDIDILTESTSAFAQKYGFGAINRINEIKEEIGIVLGEKVDIANISSMGKSAKKLIIDRAIYV